jgi:hypothetical protein
MPSGLMHFALELFPSVRICDVIERGRHAYARIEID